MPDNTTPDQFANMSEEEAMRILADSPRLQQIIAANIGQIQQMGAQPPREHRSPWGALAGGIGNMVDQYRQGSALAENRQAQIDEQGRADRARRVLSAPFTGQGGPPPQMQQQPPPSDQNPTPMAPPMPGSLLRQSIAASGPPPPQSTDYEAKVQQLLGSVGGQPSTSSGGPPQNPRAALASALNTDPSARFRQVAQAAARAMASGDPTMMALAKSQLDAAEKEMGFALTGRERDETARHNKVGESIDFAKLKQGRWGQIEDKQGGIWFFNKDKPTDRFYVAPGSGFGQPPAGPASSPASDGGAPAPNRSAEAALRQTLPAEVRKQIDDAEQAIAQIQRGREAVQAQPGAFGAFQQNSDYLPDLRILGMNPLAPLAAAVDAPARAMRTEDQEKARATVYAQAYQEIHKLAGAALSPGEAARLKTFLPNPNDTVTELRAKLESAQEMAEQARDRLKSTYLPMLYGPSKRAPFPVAPQKTAAAAGSGQDDGPPKRAKHKIVPFAQTE